MSLAHDVRILPDRDGFVVVCHSCRIASDSPFPVRDDAVARAQLHEKIPDLPISPEQGLLL